MSLLPHFDRVALMEGGRLVDIARLAELRARQPEFARMLEGGAQEAEPVQPPWRPTNSR